MSAEFLAACLQEQMQAAEELLGLRLQPGWLTHRKLLELRRNQCLEDPGFLPWNLRALAFKHGHEMIGHIGFHTVPGADYLSGYAPGGVELGYAVQQEHRRQGYATEALLGMVNWARHSHSVPRFVLSISPVNVPSLRLAQKLGFRKIGEQTDEEDGLEEIWLLEGDGLSKLVPLKRAP